MPDTTVFPSVSLGHLQLIPPHRNWLTIKSLGRAVTGSYTVFFVSLIAHAAQFAFLLWFENPRKPTFSVSALPPLLIGLL